MSVTPKKTLSKEGQILLGSLQKAVAQTLEKKKRLGQYAVVWRNGRPVMIGEDVPQDKTGNEPDLFALNEGNP